MLSNAQRWIAIERTMPIHPTVSELLPALFRPLEPIAKLFA